MEADKKTFLLYYDMCCQKVIIYTGTPRKEIIEVIYELFRIDQKQKINILDEEGVPVVLSSYLPNNVKLYIQIQKTFTEIFIENQNLDINNNCAEIPNSDNIAWVWNVPSRNSHKITNNGKTVSQAKNETQASCRGSLKIEEG